MNIEERAAQAACMKLLDSALCTGGAEHLGTSCRWIAGADEMGGRLAAARRHGLHGSCLRRMIGAVMMAGIVTDSEAHPHFKGLLQNFFRKVRCYHLRI